MKYTPWHHRKAFLLWKEHGTIRSVCRNPDMPSERTIHKWKLKDFSCPCPYHGWEELLAKEKNVATLKNTAVTDARKTKIQNLIDIILQSITHDEIVNESVLNRIRILQTLAREERLIMGKPTEHVAVKHNVSGDINFSNNISVEDIKRLADLDPEDVLDAEILDTLTDKFIADGDGSKLNE